MVTGLTRKKRVKLKMSYRQKSTQYKKYMPTSTIAKWKLFKLEKPEPHIQMSHETDAGLIVKDLFLREPKRSKTIAFLAMINATGSFRTLEVLEAIIRQANHEPREITYRNDANGIPVVEIFT